MTRRLQPPDRHPARDVTGSSCARARVALRSHALALVAAISLATGCASTAPPLRYHALSAVAPTAPAVAYDGPVLQVANVRLPAQFDRLEWIRETAAGQFDVSEVDHWAAPPSTLARQALAEDLAARLPPGRTAFPGAAWPAAEAQLSIDILRLTVRDGEASMLLGWSLRRAGATASDTGAQWTLNAPADDPAAALNALLAQLADRLAPVLSERARGQPR